jgi:Transposase IS116/IS110/IS902 family
VRLLVDHRERLVRQRVAINSTLQWHLHDLWPELQLPGSALFHGIWGPRITRRLARAEQTMRVRIVRDELRRIRELSQTIKTLEAEIADPVAQIAPHLFTEPGFGPLTAAKLVGEIAGAERFATDAKLARAAGVAPIPVSSARPNRHRLDRGGNRQVNATIHCIAVTRLGCHPETQGLHRPQPPAVLPRAARAIASREKRLWTASRLGDIRRGRACRLPSESLLAPEVSVRVVVVIGDLSIARRAIDRPGRGRAVQTHQAVTELARGVLQGLDKRRRESAPSELRRDVHALDFAGAVAERLDTPAAGRHAIEEADDERPAGRREVRRCGRRAAAQRLASEDVVLVEHRVDELARRRPPSIASAKLEGHAIMLPRRG